MRWATRQPVGPWTLARKGELPWDSFFFFLSEYTDKSVDPRLTPTRATAKRTKAS